MGFSAAAKTVPEVPIETMSAHVVPGAGADDEARGRAVLVTAAHVLARSGHPGDVELPSGRELEQVGAVALLPG